MYLGSSSFRQSPCSCDLACLGTDDSHSDHLSKAWTLRMQLHGQCQTIGLKRVFNDYKTNIKLIHYLLHFYTCSYIGFSLGICIITTTTKKLMILLENLAHCFVERTLILRYPSLPRFHPGLQTCGICWDISGTAPPLYFPISKELSAGGKSSLGRWCHPVPIEWKDLEVVSGGAGWRSRNTSSRTDISILLQDQAPLLSLQFSLGTQRITIPRSFDFDQEQLAGRARILVGSYHQRDRYPSSHLQVDWVHEQTSITSFPCRSENTSWEENCESHSVFSTPLQQHILPSRKGTVAASGILRFLQEIFARLRVATTGESGLIEMEKSPFCNGWVIGELHGLRMRSYVTRRMIGKGSRTLRLRANDVMMI